MTLTKREVTEDSVNEDRSEDQDEKSGCENKNEEKMNESQKLKSEENGHVRIHESFLMYPIVLKQFDRVPVDMSVSIGPENGRMTDIAVKLIIKDNDIENELQDKKN